MEKDQRLTPLPGIAVDLQPISQDYPSSYAPFYDDENFDEKRSLRHYVSVVYKRLPLILALTILTTAIAAFYMYRQPSVYQAQTEMIIEARRARGGQTKDAININFGNDVNYNNTQLQLLQNPDLMKTVVINLGLQRQPNLFAAQNKGVMSTLRSVFSREKETENTAPSLQNLPQNTVISDDATQVSLTPEESARAENYAGVFLGGLKVDQVPMTNLVNIVVTNTNPELTAKVADEVAETFIEENVKRETQGSKKNYEEISKSIEELKSTIGSQEVELINFTTNHDLPLGVKGGDLSANILQGASTSLQTAIDERSRLEASYNALVRASGSPDQAMNMPEISDNKNAIDILRLNTERKAKLQDDIRDYNNQIDKAETELSQLKVRYTDENPKILEKEAQIAKLKDSRDRKDKDTNAQIERDQKNIQEKALHSALVSVKSKLDAARIRENQLRAEFNKQSAKAQVGGENETRLTTLRRELETNRTLLDSYTQQQKQLELLIAGSRPDNLKISNHAVAPTAPIGPQRTRNIFIAFLISLAAGIGLAFMMDYLDDSVKSSDDIGRYLGLPTLALIPHQNISEKRRIADLALTKNGSSVVSGSLALMALQDQRSPMAEAYRHLRTSLLFSSAGKPPQTILVTSSQPSEGKTTTAINTAITLAQSDVEVVIIDCDLRRPRLHTHFAMNNSHGLTNYLSGEKNPENLIKTYENLPKLKVITSGPIPPNPAELLSSNEMKNLLQFLKGKYKHIIVDSPPAISFTDAAILSTQVDGVVLVAMANKSSLHLMRRFKQRLGTIGARIYGVVLNGIKASSMEYDYYSSTYSYYGAPEDDSTPLMEDVRSIHDTNE